MFIIVINISLWVHLSFKLNMNNFIKRTFNL